MTEDTETQYVKKNQRLPLEIHEEFRAITSDTHKRNFLIKQLVDANWTYEAISDASGLTRERVRQIANASAALADEMKYDLGINIPTPPIKTKKEPKQYVEPDPDLLARMLELQPYAQQVRANGTKYREEGEEYTALLNKAHNEDGVPLYRLGKRLGVTHGALRFRLARYGYKVPPKATSKVYQPIKQENRVLKNAK